MLNDTYYVPEGIITDTSEELTVHISPDNVNKLQILALIQDCNIDEVLSMAIDTEFTIKQDVYPTGLDTLIH
jgi:hypothetical protein